MPGVREAARDRSPDAATESATLDAAHMPSTATKLPAPVAAEGGFRALYDQYFTFVWRCLRALGVAETHVDDAAQEVFLVAHRRLPEFRGESSLRTWLYGIVRNVAANQRRTQRRKGGLAHLDEAAFAGAEPSPEMRLAERERAEFVVRFAEGLDPKKRDVFVLALVEQLTIPEVAEILEIPVNTAYTRLRAVRAELRSAIERSRSEP